jgi:putative phage-type endonuclease
MQKHLIITSTKDMSRELWLLNRKKGIGASDVGTILGLNQYKAAIELFYERLDSNPEFSVENIAAFMGHYHEDSVADLWQYWNKDPRKGTQAEMMKNYREGNIQRKCQRVNAYVSNPKYPWLFVSLDRKINKGDRGEEGALEIKTIAGYEAQKWDTGIPPSHIVQVMTQLLVCEFSFGELATLRDGRQFDVWPFEFNQNIATQIIERTRSFWENVQEGRKILTQKYEAVMGHNMRKANDLQAQLESLEPEPDGTEAYEKFLKDKFKRSLAEKGLVRGTPEDLKLALEHRSIKEQMKKLDEQARLCENNLKRRIGDGTTLDLGFDGRVTWSGDPKRFINRVKA